MALLITFPLGECTSTALQEGNSEANFRKCTEYFASTAVRPTLDTPLPGPLRYRQSTPAAGPGCNWSSWACTASCRQGASNWRSSLNMEQPKTPSKKTSRFSPAGYHRERLPASNGAPYEVLAPFKTAAYPASSALLDSLSSSFCSASLMHHCGFDRGLETKSHSPCQAQHL